MGEEELRKGCDNMLRILTRPLTSPQVSVWCGAVRCRAAQCGAVRRGAVRCGTVRRGAVRCGAARRGAVWSGAVRCDVV